MTEKNLLNAPIDVYLSKQESLVLDFIRRALQAETKVAMLEEALNQTKLKLETVEAQNATCASTLDQSINGIQALQVDKEQYKNEAARLSTDVADLRSKLEVEHDLNQTIRRLQTELNDSKQTTQRLQTELVTKKSNYNATLAAYDNLSEQLETTTAELNALKSQKRQPTKAKSKTKDEWSQ